MALLLYLERMLEHIRYSIKFATHVLAIDSKYVDLKVRRTD